MSKKVKNFAITILVVALIIGIMTFFSSSSDNTNSITTENSLVSNKASGLPVGNTEIPTDNFSNILASIKSINIDVSIFENPSFKALRDYPISLGTDIIGRQNPFAPVGTDTDPAPTTNAPISVQFQTIQPTKVTSTTATFGAQTDIPNVSLNVLFEYGTTNAYGNSTGPIPFSKTGTALFPVAGLIPSSTYFVRAILINGGDSTLGNTMTFVTKAK